MCGFCAARTGLVCRRGYRLDEISAESVIAALGELTELYPAAPAARDTRLQAGLSEIDHQAAR
jgi:hypothetical protein